MGFWLSALLYGLQALGAGAWLTLAYRAWRRDRRERADLAEGHAMLEQLTALNTVLMLCARRSFLYHHLPFWRAWQLYSGWDFQVRIVGLDDDNGNE